MKHLHRTWAEINLDALVHNFKFIRSMTDAKIFSVVKANAYGHSVDIVAPALDEAGTDYFAVSNLDEAKELRVLGINKPILILGYTPPTHAKELSELDLIQTVFSYDFAQKLNQNAAESGVSVKAHIKLDTGMGRIGFDFRNDSFNELVETRLLIHLENLKFEGVFTHFPVADSDKEYTSAQFDRFMRAVGCLEEYGFEFKIKHCCNSAAFLNFSDMHLDAVRPGIILYGLTPDVNLEISKEFKPVMSFKSVVSQVKTVLAGETVSYGKTYTFEKSTRVATVTAGYADGVLRLLSNKARVLINGKYAKIVGRICMDQFCVDVSDIENVKEGDTVTLFGEGLPVEEFAKHADTINYEVVCSLSKRVPRIYIKNGMEYRF